MTTYAITPTVASFADAVRDALGDLPAEEVDDLTEGLEADLAEAFADGRGELPDPIAYAEELRTAAGLPRRAARRPGLDAARSTLTVAARKAWSAVGPVAVELRPVWWVARAVVAYFAVVWATGEYRQLMPDTVVEWFVLAVAVVISVAWGLGRWQPSWFRVPIIVGNVLAVALLVPVLNHQGDQTTTWADAEDALVPANVDSNQMDLTGVYSDGNPVTNIFAFDAKGRALRDVQLFDEMGRPLVTSTPGGNGCLDADCNDVGLWAPAVLSTGKYAWNVYPMRMLPSDDNLTYLDDERPQVRPAPYANVPSVDRERTAQANSPYADGPDGTD
ncbi:hypothetical protein [Aeromicrobium terrae]|uniref:Uncharacterized protein n=1 Tax=Aeromicrobium terrae TaxID=2498846 RepID=A0A5C8NJX2_9ACTN|nr:hypothetical protein [Aeromicrobium terrae]TXL61542.1 hypothetical protein FHP06_08975 [Aeromicrobium terrae]